MKTPEVINLQVTPSAWNYIRVAVGRCPHDEVHPLIVALEQEVNAQVKAQNEQAQVPRSDMLSGGVMPASYGGVAPLSKPNGSGAAAEQETTS